MDELLNIFNSLSSSRIKINSIKTLNRSIAQNNISTKRIKSDKMKEFWRIKKEKEKQDERDRLAIYEYIPQSCYCHLGNPPCGWCTRDIEEED